MLREGANATLDSGSAPHAHEGMFFSGGCDRRAVRGNVAGMRKAGDVVVSEQARIDGEGRLLRGGTAR